ncbi:MAG: type II toxin-antitoxin system Phd/YefM family antitoxin [Bacteroidota bacterium]|nr:type II toxin-antitoxin system Phd/YefM family antitoxin [Bacteroidota bacterium]
MNQIEFKSLPMMALRRSPGEILDEVSQEGAAFIIERNGQQKACLVPVSCFLPDIQPSRLTAEINRLMDLDEQFWVTIGKDRQIQFSFKEHVRDDVVEVTVTLPHGYPNAAPIVAANPLKDECPHRWSDGTLCIYGASAIWNPGKHDLSHVINQFRRWIQHYSVWLQTGSWPKDQ